MQTRYRSGENTRTITHGLMASKLVIIAAVVVFVIIAVYLAVLLVQKQPSLTGLKSHLATYDSVNKTHSATVVSSQAATPINSASNSVSSNVSSSDVNGQSSTEVNVNGQNVTVPSNSSYATTIGNANVSVSHTSSGSGSSQLHVQVNSTGGN
ncbi:hypothetical protein M1512_00720 [Patescibacteria group bacterium]|nr:hypothetical protein [Patescibacteria group bacterium]